MTSAKRMKMKNRFVFTRISGIVPYNVYSIFKADNPEVCAQYCDEQKKCSIFEFKGGVTGMNICHQNIHVTPPLTSNFAHALEYEQIDSDLFAGAFDTIIYLKVKGVFSKSLSKEKHSCVGMVEFQEYVTHEVPKWLKPVKKAVQKQSSVPFSPTPGETDNDANSGGGSSVLMPSNAATVKEQNESTKLTSSTELYGTISMGTTSVGEAREITTVTHFELPSQKTSVADTLESRLISSSTYDEPHEEKESPTAMTVSSERVMEHNEASSVATLGTMAPYDGTHDFGSSADLCLFPYPEAIQHLIYEQMQRAL
ncbi:hypothetical protein PRIPAC_78159 [Pristionchus pacificus]|uniref:Uncharacterized protein n=1 Tax=Pristionchus pacificus TaxID=54126 RepID=A0A2A6BY76_PRIPA|nr:hypothetical protein PRIPAC_78159 [Pristionchus pacificus]|eukprot:PDM70767.1 hypothetical protein PRIPAC_44971 [Pristionchus pacificus]